MPAPPRIDREKCDAVLFDLDGVLTPTAKIHAAAWKQMFDEFLERRAKADGTAFVPFDTGEDYRRYVDGKPRYDGIQSFLDARGLKLPYGKPSDHPTAETVCGLGNRKNELVHEIMATEGIEAYPGSVKAVNFVRAHGLKTAVVSSSRNCRPVLRAAGIEHLFDTVIDGQIAAEKGLAGKPEPDTFLAAARILGVEPARAIVVEDAIAGVEAGKNGAFGLVIGLARAGNAEELRQAGADIVVADLDEFFQPGR